jgi:hypothetical protein
MSNRTMYRFWVSHDAGVCRSEATDLASRRVGWFEGSNRPRPGSGVSIALLLRDDLYEIRPRDVYEIRPRDLGYLWEDVMLRLRLSSL